MCWLLPFLKPLKVPNRFQDKNQTPLLGTQRLQRQLLLTLSGSVCHHVLVSFPLSFSMCWSLCHLHPILCSLAPHLFLDWSIVVLEKAMAPHSSTLAWKIPWMVEPGRLQSMGPLRVGHDRMTSLSLFPFTHWRRKWQPTPVFLPRESQGRGSLVGFCLWGCTESDTTEVT